MHGDGHRLALAGKEPPEPPACACLIVIQGRDLGRKFVLEQGVTTIGRSETNGICLPYEWVSRNHAAIVCDHRGVVLRDARSCGGTFVNDLRITERVLGSGDLIKLGQTILRFFVDDGESTGYHEQLFRLSTLDALTQVFNRRYFAEVLEREIRRARELDNALSVVMLDIDDFRRCAETFGESAGNTVLRQLANVLRRVAREVDVIGRWQGDTFAIILPSASLEDAVAFAEKTRRAVEECRFMCDGERIRVTISLGVAALERTDETADALVARAIARIDRADRRGG